MTRHFRHALALLALLAATTATTVAQSAAVAGDTDGSTREATAATLRVDALRDSILQHITGAQTPRHTLDITRLGARGNGTTDCRPAFDRAMRRAEKLGGAIINVRAGTYYIKGPITLTSNVTLHLDEGAILKFDPDPALYPNVETSWEGTYLVNHSPLIYGRGLHDVAITGRGTIDGNAMTTFATWKPRQKPAQARSRQLNHQGAPIADRVFGDGSYLRPQLIQLYDCRGVTLEGFKITNSPFWCVHLLRSENVICRALRYDAKLINNDGIDPESSRNVLIEDISFDNGDDNVAIKAGRDNDGWAAPPAENIIIRRCHFKGLHAVVIGSEMSGGVSNVIVEDCDYAGYCKRGIYVKTNRDRGGYVRGLYVRRCRFGAVEDLFYVTSMYAGEGKDSPYPSVVEDISVDGLTADSVSAAAVTIQGTDGQPVRRVTLKGIDVRQARIGVSIDQAEGVTFADCHIGGRSGVPSLDTKQDNLWR